MSCNPLWVCGTDEAGLGSWAGPLMVAGVLVPVDWVPPLGLTDSKRLSGVQRESLLGALERDPKVRFYVRVVSVGEIDQKGVYGCLREAHEEVHERLTEGLGEHEVRRIADGTLTLRGTIESIPKADLNFPAVSAASIFAKVLHDREMARIAQIYPGYGLERHQGYGTKAHEEALQRLGPSPEHRKSYAPVAAATKVEIPSLLDIMGDLPQE